MPVGKLENNCHWRGCDSSQSYGVIQVATACAAEYNTTDLDFIAKGNDRNSWNEMVSGSSGLRGLRGLRVWSFGSAFAHDPTCTPFLELSDDVQSTLGKNVTSSTTFSADGAYYARFDMQHADSNSDQTLLLWGGDSKGKRRVARRGIKADGTLFMESTCDGPTGSQTSDSVSSTGALTDGAYYFLEFYYDSATETAKMWKLCDDYWRSRMSPVGRSRRDGAGGGQDPATLILSTVRSRSGTPRTTRLMWLAGTMIQLEVYDCPLTSGAPPTFRGRRRHSLS